MQNGNLTPMSPRATNCTFQLCIDTKCLIFQMLNMDEMPQSLENFHRNYRFTFIGLELDLSTFVSGRGLIWDKGKDIEWCEYKDLLDRVNITEVYKRNPDNELLTNWGARVINDDQVEYACLVAYVSYKLAHFILG